MTKKTVRKKTPKQRDLRVISRMYLQGMTQGDIATELKISQPTVSREIKKLVEEWKVERVYDINEAKQRELAKIDNLELEYWEAWKRSQQDAVMRMKKAIQSDGTTKQEVSERIEGQVGDARFLNGVMDCIKQRCNILGVEAPDKLQSGSGSEIESISIPAHMIAKDFTDVYRDIINRGSVEYALDGGRGSTKSSFVALSSIMLLVNNPEWHMLALRQVSDTLRKSVYSQLTWAISELELDDKFKSTLNPLQITYIPTGQTIYFSGASDPKNLKSIKPPFGYIALLWFEEYDQFAGEAAIRSIVQSALRGGDVAYRFETWNTPRSKNHWCNKYIAIPKKGRYHLRTNYLNVPKEWLGKVFLDEAEFLKSVNEEAYRHEYLGDATGIGGTVFENVQIRAITDKEIKAFETSCHGLDFGYFPDPAHYSQSHYNPAKRTLYIYGEVRKWKSSNKEMYNAMVKQGLLPSNLLICDREPKDIADLKTMGANARGAEKDAGSRDYSYKWLQRLAAIVIDNTRAPYAAEEFLNCEMEQTKDGEFISSYPEKNDHAIDSVRYGTNLYWRKAGE
jgi:phage terminase large subunit